MKSKLCVLATILMLTACGQPDGGIDPGKVTASDTNDLINPVFKTESSAAKSERLIRKLRLAEVLISKKLNLTAPTLQSCVSDSEAARTTDWNLTCENSTAQGRAYFSYVGTTIQKIDLEMSTTIANFGIAREEVSVSEIADVTDSAGKRSVTFKLSWNFYKNSISDSTRICKATSAPIKLNVLSKTTNGSTTSYVDTLQIDRISISCNQDLITPTIDDTSLEFKNSTLNVTGDSHLLSGNLNFDFKDGKLTYSGTMLVNEVGIKEPQDLLLKQWGCAGQPLCFP